MNHDIIAKLRDLFWDPAEGLTHLRGIVEDWADNLQKEQPEATVTIGTYRNAAMVLGDLAFEYEEETVQ